MFMFSCKVLSKVRSGSSYSGDALSIRDVRGLELEGGRFARDSVRVCRKGTVRGGDISGSSALEPRLVVVALVD